MDMRKCKITFIAHGATIHSEESRFYDTENYPPLSDAGTHEIEKICEYLKKRGIKNDCIYASPSLRCTQSAQYIAKLFKTNFTVIPELYARKYGEWNGLTFSKILENFNSVKEYCLATPKDGESLQELNQRIGKIINELVENNHGKRIIVVTTPEVIKSAIAMTLSIPIESQANILIKNGSASQISYFTGWSSLIYSGYVPL